MFIFIRRSSNVYLFIINIVRRSLKKFFIQFSRKASTLLFRILCNNCVCETLSNASDTFKLNRNITFFFELFQIMWIFFVINCNAVLINRYFLTFICVFDSVACVSRTYRICFDIVDSTSCLVYSTTLSIYTI